MNIVLQSFDDKELAKSGQDIVRLFYPKAKLHQHQVYEVDLTLTVTSYIEGGTLFGRVELKTETAALTERVSTDELFLPGEDRSLRKRLIKLALVRVLTKYTGTDPSPWGILTGIRPTKIVHRLLDDGWETPAILRYMCANFDMSLAKASLLTEIALVQRKYLLSAEQARKKVSIYIGIPFCPTRCAYCSFPAYSVDAAGGLLGPFLQALRKEIQSVGKALAKHGKTVQTIYIGGGTPTVFDSESLALLLETVQVSLVSGETTEITLEAGRPDTISEAKLLAAAEFGVTRLSINPQTMNLHTLHTIGRQHTPEMIRESIYLARETGFQNINMDIIVGLPGENLADVKKTLADIEHLKPENLTVHTLAVKRASHLKEAQDRFVMPAPETVEKMLRLTRDAAEKMGMHPYYLYRQKMMVSPLENIGFARVGFDCVYNIQMIEERQSILGLGCGAGTKFVDPGTHYLTSQYNPKDPETYLNKIEDIIARKVDKLGSFG